MTTAAAAPPAHAKARLDQWLWFARFAKTRSLAARLCAAGAVMLNGNVVDKANRAVRVGDIVVLPQGSRRRTVRVMGLGTRRGPAAEARLLYEEIAPAPCVRGEVSGWLPLLDTDQFDDPTPPPSCA